MRDRLRITVIIEIIIPRIIHYPVALGIIPESRADFRVLFKFRRFISCLYAHFILFRNFCQELFVICVCFVYIEPPRCVPVLRHRLFDVIDICPDGHLNRARVRLLSRLCAPAVLVPCRSSPRLCRLLPVPLGYRQPFLTCFQAVLFVEVLVFLVRRSSFALLLGNPRRAPPCGRGVRHNRDLPLSPDLTLGVPDAVFKLSRFWERSYAFLFSSLS